MPLNSMIRIFSDKFGHTVVVNDNVFYSLSKKVKGTSQSIGFINDAGENKAKRSVPSKLVSTKSSFTFPVFMFKNCGGFYTPAF